MFLSLLAGLLIVQQPADHAAMVMGFDQDRSAHHFSLFTDGGAIEIQIKETKEAKDTKERDAIRVHLSHIATMFGAGNFDAPMLVHETKNVPGIDVLSARHDRLTYKYAETPTGGRIDIVTGDPDALAALHAFLRYQIREHKTGDAETVAARR
jgi:hypothetical protein